MDLTQIHDLIIQLFILHQKKGLAHAWLWCQCWGCYDWQVQMDDALPVKLVQQTLKIISWALRSHDVEARLILLSYLLSYKIWGGEWWVPGLSDAVALVKAKPRNIKKTSVKRICAHSPNSFTETKSSKKRFERFFVFFLDVLVLRLQHQIHTCTDFPLSQRESDSLNHWPYKWARRIIVRIGVSGRCKVE